MHKKLTRAEIVRAALLYTRLERIVLVVLMLAAIVPAFGADSEQRQFYEPSLAKRIANSEIVCYVTVLNTFRNGRTQAIDGADFHELVAVASVHRVFKGRIASYVQFRYFGQPEDNGVAVKINPPEAFFQSGRSYIVFLKGDEQHLEVAVPVIRMEIRTADLEPATPSAGAQSSAAIAELLFAAVRAEPKTIGRAAEDYFSWAEEMVGKDAVSAVEPFLTSEDELVRYQAAWWLSFRQVSDAVISVLVKTSKNSQIEAWARSEAKNRLKEMGR